MSFRPRDYLDLTATQHALLFPDDEPEQPQRRDALEIAGEFDDVRRADPRQHQQCRQQRTKFAHHHDDHDDHDYP